MLRNTEVVSTFRKLQSYTSVSNVLIHSFIQPLFTEHLLQAGDCAGLQGEAVEGNRQGPYPESALELGMWSWSELTVNQTDYMGRKKTNLITREEELPRTINRVGSQRIQGSQCRGKEAMRLRRWYGYWCWKGGSDPFRWWLWESMGMEESPRQWDWQRQRKPRTVHGVGSARAHLQSLSGLKRAIATVCGPRHSYPLVLSLSRKWLQIWWLFWFLLLH